MSERKFDILVFIGRFQPLHIGHVDVIKTALNLADKVILLIGSSNQPRTPKNPWTFSERKAMIYEVFAGHDRKYDLYIEPLHDQKYNDQKWAAGVQEAVTNALYQADIGNEMNTLKIGIIGHSKDESSYYLKMFPQWELIEHDMNEQINATDLRSLMFEGKNLKFLQGVLPETVFTGVEMFTHTDEFKLLQNEYNIIKKYKKAWEAAPYAPMFVTVDAVVVQSGHILLVQRDAAPGEGLWAMPGGFLEQNEYIHDGVLRELKEETKIKVAPAMLRGCIKQSKVFDRPDRSARGRTITHAFLIELPAGPLPAVKGSDDARKAAWVKFSDVKEDQMFEDHYHIIQDMLGKL